MFRVTTPLFAVMETFCSDRQRLGWHSFFFRGWDFRRENWIEGCVCSVKRGIWMILWWGEKLQALIWFNLIAFNRNGTLIFMFTYKNRHIAMNLKHLPSTGFESALHKHEGWKKNTIRYKFCPPIRFSFQLNIFVFSLLFFILCSIFRAQFLS